MESNSPLWLLTKNPSLNNLFVKLQEYKKELTEHSDQECTLTFSKKEIDKARQNFSLMILMGEKRLHQLCELICDHFFDSYRIESQVIGEISSVGERFTLSQSISRKDLYSTMDIDIGNRQINKLRFWENEKWNKAYLVSNILSYQPLHFTDLNIHRIISRIKAEEEIWNKVVDEIFELDKIIKHDKKLRHLSRYIKDVFGIKIIVDKPANARDVQKELRNLEFNNEHLGKFRLSNSDKFRRLRLIEFKDHLTSGKEKGSGWKAYKSVFEWADKMFEIQIQTLSNFLHERERLTTQSHTGFKLKREDVRDKVSAQIPLFSFYRQLLKWLFLNMSAEPPAFPGVKIVLKER